MKKNRTIPIRIQKQKFIIDYLGKNFSADVTDSKFHDAWHARFGGNRTIHNWGACPCPNSMVWLKKLYDQGILDRGIISLGENWQPGFPRWVYGYTLHE